MKSEWPIGSYVKAVHGFKREKIKIGDVGQIHGYWTNPNTQAACIKLTWVTGHWPGKTEAIYIKWLEVTNYQTTADISTDAAQYYQAITGTQP